MPSTAQLKLIEDLLDLPSLKVTDFSYQENVGMLVQVSARNQKAICPRCERESDKLHQNHSFLIRDINLGGQEVYLKINRRQWKCSRCKKPFSENLDFVKKRRSYTKRLAEKIVGQVLKSNIRVVALQNNLTEDVVARMLEDVAREKLEEKPKNLKKLGLDEIALIKGQGNYCAVLVDLEERKLMGMLPSRKQEDLTENQQEKLKQIKKQSPILGKMHELKEEFREILEKNTNWVSGLDNLTDWLITASRLFPNSCKTIQRWLSEIVGYFESRITQGVVEGINNKLKLIKRSAYGFKNFDNFKLRSLLSWHFSC